MSLVLDASIALAWYFEDERSTAADDVLDRVVENGATVPLLWRYEVANGLQMAVRRQRIDAAYRDASLAELRLLPITTDRAGDKSRLDGNSRFRRAAPVDRLIASAARPGVVALSPPGRRRRRGGIR